MDKKTFEALSLRLRKELPIDEVLAGPVQAALLRLMLKELETPRFDELQRRTEKALLSA